MKKHMTYYWNINPPPNPKSLALWTAAIFRFCSNMFLAVLELCKPASDSTNDTVTLSIIKHSKLLFHTEFLINIHNYICL